MSSPRVTTRAISNKTFLALGAIVSLAVVLNHLGERVKVTVVLVAGAAVLVRTARKRPPIAIAIVLYVAMRYGGWLILAAPALTILLARRYQRQRDAIEPSSTHRRRTLLTAVTVVAATLPFAGLSIGPWSAQSRFEPASSADPLFSPERGGEESLITRLARRLGFGPDAGPGQPDGLDMGPPMFPTRPPEPDNPFNWRLVVVLLVVLAVALLIWWWWRRRPAGAFSAAAPAPPLARLEAVGSRIGRDRAPHEGAITYAAVLARRTGDNRLADVGPLVSGQVYMSTATDPTQVDANLTNLEASPPAAPPMSPLSLRLKTSADRLGLTVRGLVYGALGAIALVVAGLLLLPRLDDLGEPTFEFGAAIETSAQRLQQLEGRPLIAEDRLDNVVVGPEPPKRIGVDASGVDDRAKVAVVQIVEIGLAYH